jgi:hypothetical protein
MTGGRIFARFALIVVTGAIIATAALAANDRTSSRDGSIGAGGPVSLNIRTIEGRSQLTTIMWAGSSRELTVVNLTDVVPAGGERDAYETLRMLLQRCTAINLATTGKVAGPGGCCPPLSGSGIGFAGNVKTKLQIDQAFEGGRVRQTVTIWGYRGSPFDAYTAKLLFQ